MMFATSWGEDVAKFAVFAVVGGALGIIGLAIRWVGRWIRRAVLSDVRETIREVMSPAITELREGQESMKAEFAVMRDENTAQHKQMRERLHDLEHPAVTTTTETHTTAITTQEQTP